MSQYADEGLRRLFDDAAATIPTLSPQFTDTVMTQGSRRRRTKKRSLLAAVAAVLAIVIGAASQSPGLINSSPPPPAGQHHVSPPGSRGELRAALLGRWEQTSTCQQRVNGLAAVSFGPLDAGEAIGVGPGSRGGHLPLPGVVGPGVDHIVDFAHPCAGLAPGTDVRIFQAPVSVRRDYYNVKAPGELGRVYGIASYRVVGSRTISLDAGSLSVIRSLRKPHQDHAGYDGIIRFHVRMLSPNTMTLNPVLPTCITNRCFAAGWAVAVANPGHIWHRVS